MMLKLSVIIPVYNVERYIHQCLDSVFSQTFCDMEVILVDDGSPDNCGMICEEYAKQYKDKIPVKVIHKQNAGLGSAWNDGLAQANGEWITFVDSDDWLDREYFETMFCALGSQDVDIFCAGGCFKNEGGKQTIARCFDTARLYQTREDRDYMMTRILSGERKKTGNGVLILNPTQAMWDKFYRTEFVREHHLQFKPLGAIDDVWFNFIAFDQADCIGVSTVCGYHYRQVIGSDTKRYNPKRKDCFLTFCAIVSEYLNQKECNPEIQKAVKAYTLALIRNAVNVYFCHPDNTLSPREIAKEFGDYKKEPYIAAAIWEHNNPYISGKMKIWQYIYRLPWLWPVRAIVNLKTFMRRK